ncbi:SRPBCC domain-containing protein [Actinoplanes sp. CA-142083]|uniref:SRPBCC domain-containing protein n=1 Tax=Actinoplanes sp. CA-142083 TaxID=3239903 RepID=UPI003D8CFC40
MGKDYEINLDATVDATPAQIWDAIATGPGMTTWFIGRTDIDGNTVRTAFGDNWIPTGTIKTKDQPQHFAYESERAPDGRFSAYEFLIEGRDHSATVLKSVTSGFLPGDDWADEYEAMQYGTQLFFATLVEHLRHYPGQTATPVTAFGPPVTDWDATWKALHEKLGDATVYYSNPHTLGLRTPTGLHRYIRGFHGALVADHALYTPDDTDWTAFLHTL